ncbi:AAA family ATPase [Microlunatus panaciterrae]|uniref:DNA helicase IV n=1 Tax=Microlunatus panaciterrae TaxID=400768 RepID=A0ABS2RN97_9ACTN|nr:UvrD-helicase domain-containing protein [Microlunatus panaciterrae]MBM7800183.1 DNA helicase IV [Microlunatus panaciterrae]
MTSPKSPAQPTTALEQEIAIEQAHVDLVYTRLAEATRSARQVASEGRSLFQSDRADFVREEDGTGLYERDVFAFQSAKRLAVLDAEHEGLVFGRLDHTTGEIRYVGRIGVRDGDYEPLVIDWRARAAEPFYRATPTNPMDVVRRRVLRCRGDRVIGVEDDLLDGESAGSELVVIGEGALMAALTRARGHTMRDIVATIQAEQDEAIRAPYQGVTTISGGPGTGKTVVALHRAAYLLYSHRRRFENGGVLVVGPSLVFMNYIERVLPSLGEDSVTLRPIGMVASDVVRLRGERVDEPVAAAAKGSLRMVQVLRRLVSDPLTSTPQELRLTLRGDVLRVGSHTLERIRRDVLAHHKLNQGREAAEAALLKALWRSKPADLDLEREEFDDQVSDTATYRMFRNAWWPTLSATQALARLGDREVMSRVADSVLSHAEQEAVSASYRQQLDWTVADGALLDELVDRLGAVPESEDDEISLFIDTDEEVNEVVTTMDRLAGPREIDPFAEAHQTYAHILVDEAQDITPMQWRMLRRRGAQASWTIVGDPAQSSWSDAEEAERALNETIGRAPHRHFRMSTNYRSPAEVFELAAQVVVDAYPQADLPTAVRSTGIEPELRVADGEGLPAAAVEVARELLRQVEGTVGVICPPSLLAEVGTALRQGGLQVDQTRVVAVTPLQSKGLEYDGVVVVSPDDVVAESPGGVRTLYVALTRPTQRLVTVDAAPGAIWRKSLG